MDNYKVGDQVIVTTLGGFYRREEFNLRYIGREFVVVENAVGIEETFVKDHVSIEKANTPVIISLGNDLVAAIEHAAWNDDIGSNNLSGPTPHMRTAIFNWREATGGKHAL